MSFHGLGSDFSSALIYIFVVISVVSSLTFITFNLFLSCYPRSSRPFISFLFSACIIVFLLLTQPIVSIAIAIQFDCVLRSF